MLNSSSAWVDFFVVCAAVILSTIAVFVWALFIKNTHHRRRHRRRRHESSCAGNPTLAQTGELPMARKQDDFTNLSGT